MAEKQTGTLKHLGIRAADGYAFLFARKMFYPLNRFLFHLSLRGLGYLNHKTDVDSGEALFLRNQLRGLAEPVVFDVGGNNGDYSFAVLTASPKAHVFAFEPHPHTYQRLSARIAPLGAVVTNAACGKQPGELTLYDHTHEGSGHASLYKGAIEDIQHRQTEAHTVNVVTLDDFAREHGIDHIDLLKIDTEGHELEVLSGASNLLQAGKIRALQFEFNSMNVISRTFFRDFYTLLAEYDLYRMVRDGLIPLPEYSPTMEIFAFQNIAALRRGASNSL